MTCAAFARRAAPAIAALSRDLLSGAYHPRALRHVTVPKTGGGSRALGIPAVIDRIAQTAAAQALGPRLEAEFEESSFAYRPGRGVDRAIAYLQQLRAAGYTHVVESDFDDFFDTIPHDALLARLAESLDDGPLGALIALWLAAAEPGGRGLAQGSPLSPLLANLYLDRFDEAMSERGVRIVRYADDFVLAVRDATGAAAALARVERLAGDLGLALNRDKTRVTDFDRGFRFLGYQLVRSLALKTGPGPADPEALLADVTAIDAHAAAAPEEDAAAKGYAPGLRTLHVTVAGRRLNIRNQAFTVEERDAEGAAWRELIALPHQRIDRIDLWPGVDVTHQAMDLAAATAVPLAFVTSHGATRATFAPSLAPRARRHLAQARTCLDPARRLALAQIIVLGRLRSQRNLLRKLSRERRPPPPPVARAIVTLGELIGHDGRGRVASAATVAAAMGFEGQAAAAYWPALAAIAPPPFAFTVRQRHPPPDAANLVLNLFASLLARDVGGAVHAADLHPGFGALHEPDDARDACVYDLMEEFRANLVDGLFVYVVNRRIVRSEMFVATVNGWRMDRAAAAALIRAYETRCATLTASARPAARVTLRQRMIEQAFALAAHHEGRGGYHPYETPF